VALAVLVVLVGEPVVSKLVLDEVCEVVVVELDVDVVEGVVVLVEGSVVVSDPTVVPGTQN
jgi:hypothetical protein